MQKLSKLAFISLFLLGAVSQAESATVARSGVAGRGGVTSGAFINRYYPGWGKAMQKLVSSQEGKIMARFEADLGLGGQADSPLMEFVDILGKKGHDPKSILGSSAGTRESLAQEFLRIFVPRQADELAGRAEKPSLSRKALIETLAKMRRLSQGYGLSLDAESAQFKHFNSAYRKASEKLGTLRLAGAKKIAGGAREWAHYEPGSAVQAQDAKSAGIDRPSLKLWSAGHEVLNVNGESSVSLGVAFKHNTGAVLFKVPAAGSGEKPGVTFVRGQEGGPYKSRRYEVTQARAGRVARLVSLLKDTAARKDKSVARDVDLKLTIEAFEAQAKAPKAGKAAMPTPKWLVATLALLTGTATQASALQLDPAGASVGAGALITLLSFLIFFWGRYVLKDEGETAAIALFMAIFGMLLMGPGYGPA